VIEHYRDLLSDEGRINCFKQAIHELVRPESIVIEIGAALGTYSFFASRAGAKKVYAIEMSDIFPVGKELARRNNLADKIFFIHGKSTEIDIPEKADLIIMEDYSPFFLYAGLEAVLTDARQRFLKPEGTFLPSFISLKLAPVEYHAMHQKIDCFRNSHDHFYGLDWSYTTELAFNQPYHADLNPKKLLTAEITIRELDLNRESELSFQFSTRTTIFNEGTIHGLLGWWDARFTPNLYYSNSPRHPSTGWGQLFFPLRYPMAVKQGEVIEISLMALPSKHQKSVDYKWGVRSDWQEQEGNTFRGSYLNLENLLKFAPEAQVQLSFRGELLNFLLAHCRKPISWQALAEELVRAYPHQFPTISDALKQLPDLLKDLIH
jgi:SAM-dependent methyltransferase